MLLTGAAGASARAAVAGYALLMMIIGGRIIPSFTRNWLATRRARAGFPVPFNRQDGGGDRGGARGARRLGRGAGGRGRRRSPGSRARAIVAWRLSRWRGAATWREPLLLVLHVAFGFVGLGFLAIAAAAVGLAAGGRRRCT